MVRIAYLGTGWIANWHWKAMQQCEGIEVAGAFSVGPALCDRCARWGVRAYASYEQMLADPAVDAVAIFSPSHLHYDQTRKALEAGKHVLVEKPVFLQGEQHDELAALADKVGRVLMPAHNFVYRPVVRRLKEVLESGELGIISHVSLRAVHFIPEAASSGWRKSHAASGGGALIDSGMHLVYQLLYLLGVPERVSAFSARRHYTHLDDEDIAQISLQYADGTIGTILQSWAADDPGAGEIRLEGNRGVAVITDALHHDGRELETDSGYAESFGHLARHFVACVEEGAAPLSTVVDALCALEIIQRAYEAAETNSVLRL